MSRRTEKRRYGKYNKFDVVYADFGKNPHGIQGGIRPGIIISCDASNHDGAPQVSVVPLPVAQPSDFPNRAKGSQNPYCPVIHIKHIAWKNLPYLPSYQTSQT